ncbi:zinc finger protein 628 [Galendromus occidentalis]|uniref:Zinc finger protein 628 n=1 Tax=Galendromus occidentalis TaxID=34638 RepID=A0AAJ6QR90_9ACAR|nr:zinc finger protein 628 [Galendromus occidentalis]
MDASKLNLVVATAALQGIGYNSDRLRQLFESSLLQTKETKEAEPDHGFFEGPGHLSVDGSKVAKFSPALNLFKCIYCGVTGNVQRLAEHYLASHVDTSSQIFKCPNCPYTSTLARCVRMHLTKQHGLTEIPPELWASAHPLLAETTKLLNDTKTFVSIQSSPRALVGSMGMVQTLANQIPLLPLPNKSQTGKSKVSNNPPAANGGMVKKRYTCERCAYSTDRRDLYNRHENIHKEDKPFHCYVCHKLFNRADHVKKHFLRIHKGRPYDVALIRRQTANMGGSLGGNAASSVVPATALSLACPEPTNGLSAPFALALAQQAAQTIQGHKQSSAVPQQQAQPSPVNVSLSIGALVAPTAGTDVVVPIGPITPANEETINPLRGISPPPATPPLSKSFATIKRKADSSTSTSKVLVETPESPVVCLAKNTASDRVMERHVRSSLSKTIRQKAVELKIQDGVTPGAKTVRENQNRLKKKELRGSPQSADSTKQPVESSTEKTSDSAALVRLRSRSSSPSSTKKVPSSSSPCDPAPSNSPKKRDSAVLDPSQVKEYACELCSWKGVDGWGLRRHFNTHLKPFRCQFCDYRAARSERLGAHVLRVHGKHLCAKCDLSFIDATALDNHVRTEHRSTNQYTRPRPASSAGSATGSGGASGSGESPTPLDDDSTEITTEFVEKDDSLMMVDDRDVDEGETIFHCRWCILSFADKLSLKYHLETKHSGAPVGNISNDSNEFSPAFPYQCTICGFKCFTQGTIMDHMRIHSGQLARCHANDGGPRGAPCGFSTPFDPELTRHVANLHGQRGGHCSQCLHCGLIVNRADELMDHITELHHLKPLECNVCRKAFLEFFPEFYGRVCPSTAPLSDQYTHLPQFLASNPSGFLEKLLTDVYKNLTEQRSLDAKTASIILSTIHKLKDTKVARVGKPERAKVLRKTKQSKSSVLLRRRSFQCSRCASNRTFFTYGAKKVHLLLKHYTLKK